MLVRNVPLLIAELGFLDRRDDGPMMANRAMLNPPPAEPKRLQRSSGNPDGREKVTVPAADHDVATEPVASHPQGCGLEKDRRGDDHHAPNVGGAAPLGRSPSVRAAKAHTKAVLPRDLVELGISATKHTDPRKPLTSPTTAQGKVGGAN